MDKLVSQPLGIEVGEIYKAYNNISRQVVSVDLKCNTVTFVEGSNGYGENVHGFCSVLDFLNWMESK